MPHVTSRRLAFGRSAEHEISLTDRVAGLVGSEILKIAAEIRTIVATGRRVCNLTVGDFSPREFPIPIGLRDRIVHALQAGETNYPPSDGLPELRRAIAGAALRDLGVDYPVESVLVASGARPLLYGTYQCLVHPGDTVVYPVPSWNNNHYAWLSGAKAVEIATGPITGFHPTVEQVAPHLAHASLLVLNTPNNPSGAIMDSETLRGIVEAVVEENRRRPAGRRKLYLLFDQIYRSLVTHGGPHAHPAHLVPEAAPWVVTVDGISKGFAATGLRVGWALGAPPLIARMRDLLGHVGTWAPRAEQWATAEFLGDSAAVDAYREEMNGRVRERLHAIYEGVTVLRNEGLPIACVEPQGAIYLSLQLSIVGRRYAGTTLGNNEAIRRALLESAGIAVVPFQAFGLRDETGWFRLSIGAVSKREIEDAIPRLAKFLRSLT